jgi:hypothetical protein
MGKDLRSLMVKSNSREDFEFQTKIVVEKAQRQEVISGIPEKIYIYRSWFDEDLKKHIIEEEYELKDYIETGAEMVIRYQLRRSQETLHLGGK